MFYRFKKLLSLFLMFSCIVFLPSAKSKKTVTSQTTNFDDSAQNEQSFFAYGLSNDETDTTPHPYLILGRSDSNGAKSIALISVTDYLPGKGTWNGTTISGNELWNGTQQATILDTRSRSIWGWTVDAINGTLYTLEGTSDAPPTAYNSSGSAEIHVYVIQNDQFVEPKITKNYFNSFDLNSLPNAWSLAKGTQNRNGGPGKSTPSLSVGMAFIKGHLFYADGSDVKSAERAINTTITLSGFPYPKKWIKTLSTVATPASGDMLIASGPMGAISIIDFDSKTNKLTEIYSGNLSSDLVYPSNFKMTPLKSGIQTQYVLTFMAELKNDLTHRRNVFYQLLSVDKTGNNQVDWHATLDPMSPPLSYVELIGAPKNSGLDHTIQTIISRPIPAPSSSSATPDTGQRGIQYLTTLYYQGRDDRPYFGLALESANLFVKSGVKNEDVFGVQKDRKISDNIIGVVYGAPPLYAEYLKNINNSISISWATESTDSSSNGFAIDTSMTVGFSIEGKTGVAGNYGAVKSDTSFGIFSDYKKTLTTSHTIKNGSNMSFSESSPKRTDPPQQWPNNTGWILVSMGFDTYNVYSFRASVPDDDPLASDATRTIVDYHGTPVVILSIVPSEGSKLTKGWISFNLTNGVIRGSKEDKDHNPHPDMDSNWTDYTSGMRLPGTNSVFYVDDTSISRYWNDQSQKDIDTIPDDQKNPLKFTSDPLQVGLVNSNANTFYFTSMSTSRNTSGRIGGSIDEKVTATVAGRYGVVSVKASAFFEFNLSAEYDYATSNITTNENGWTASTHTLTNKGNATSTIITNMVLLKPTDDKKAFWVPQWAWDKGNRPWLITWTAYTGGPDSQPTKTTKPKKKTTKSLSSPKSSPAQTTSSIN